MKLRKWMFGVGLLALTASGGVVLPADASEYVQVVTRGKKEPHKESHKKPYKEPHKRPYKEPHKKPKKHVDHRIKRLPPYHSRVYYNKKCYYYHDGFFYRPCSGGYYERFRPYVGMLVPLLPKFRIRIVHMRGQEFLLCEGVLYKRVHTPHGIRYKVVGFD